jgi:hypothetical protein
VAWRRLLAPAAVVILAIGAVSGGIALRGSSGVVELPEGPTPEPSAFPSSSESWAGRDTKGLPTISVRDAIAIRDAGVDDREIAVHGWFSSIAPMPCPYTPATSPVQPVCPDEYVVLMAQPESLVTRTANGYSDRVPVGPSIQIDLDDLDTAWQPGLPEVGGGQPIEIAVVGHFDDRRSAACPADMVAACRDRFVVDRVDSVNGNALPTSKVEGVEGVGMPFDDVARIIDAVRPGISVLSAVHVDGEDGLRRMEPALAERGSSLIQEATVWVVRGLDDGELETYVLLDSTGSIYELTADGPVLVALTTPGEPASPSPSPIPEVRSTFTIEIGPVDTTVSIEVIDRTGFLDVARAATTAEYARESRIIRPGAMALRNLAPDTVLVTWTGSVCDVRPRLTIDSSVPHGPPSDLRLTDERPGCDAVGVGRAVVLRFLMDVDAQDLIGTEEVQLVEPVPSSVVGVGVIDVAAALQVQANEDDDHEIAVAGWFARARVPGACMRPADQQPPSHSRPPDWLLDPDCPATFDRLLSDDDTTPNLLSIRPVLGPLGYGWVGDEPARAQVVFVGHFDDRRAADCPPEHRVACLDAFLVDAIWYQERLVATDWVLGSSAADPATPTGTRRHVESLDAPWSHGFAEILSVGLVTRARLPELEPVIKDPMLIGDAWDWHITVIDNATKRIRTFVIADSALMDTPGGPNYRIYEIAGDEVFVTETIID